MSVGSKLTMSQKLIIYSIMGTLGFTSVVWNWDTIVEQLVKLDSPTINSKLYPYFPQEGVYDYDAYKNANLSGDTTPISVNGVCGQARAIGSDKIQMVDSITNGKCPSIDTMKSYGYEYVATVEDYRPIIQKDGFCGRASGTPNEGVYPEKDENGDWKVPTINGRCPTNRELKQWGDFNYKNTAEYQVTSDLNKRSFTDGYITTTDVFIDPVVQHPVQTPIAIQGKCGLVKDKETGEIINIEPKETITYFKSFDIIDPYPSDNNGMMVDSTQTKCFSNEELNEMGYEYIGTADNVRPSINKNNGSCGAINIIHTEYGYGNQNYLLGELLSTKEPVSFEERNGKLYISPLKNGICPSAGELREAQKYVAKQYGFYLEYEGTDDYLKQFDKYIPEYGSETQNKFNARYEAYRANHTVTQVEEIPQIVFGLDTSTSSSDGDNSDVLGDGLFDDKGSYSPEVTISR